MATWIETSVVLEADYRNNYTSYGPVKYPLLAEGDSWFSVNGQPGDNLLKALSLPDSSVILSFAYPGDQIRKMTKIGTAMFLGLLLKEPTPFWKAMLLSGGGNDFIADASKIIQKAKAISDPVDPWSYVDANTLGQTLANVAAGYKRLDALRDGTSHAEMPLLTHTYDYATPRNASAKILGFSTGPWLFPKLEAAQVPKGMQPMVADTMFTELANTIKSLADPANANFIKGLTVVDTRGELTPADANSTGKNNDWLNEIHPTKDGYRKIAEQRVNQALAVVLTGP
jgi:lysophospholipase L1-like esterase